MKSYLALIWANPEHRHSLALVAILFTPPFLHYVLGVR